MKHTKIQCPIDNRNRSSLSVTIRDANVVLLETLDTETASAKWVVQKNRYGDTGVVDESILSLDDYFSLINDIHDNPTIKNAWDRFMRVRAIS